MLHKRSPYAKIKLNFPMPYWEHVSPLSKTTSHQGCVGIFSLKRNQKPLAFAQHSHWSECSLKLTCHQRKPHFLSSFLSLSLSSVKRSLMGTRIYHKKEFRISPWPFQKATSSASSQNITFHRTQCLKIENQETAENTYYCFSKKTLPLNVRKL